MALNYNKGKACDAVLRVLEAREARAASASGFQNWRATRRSSRRLAILRSPFHARASSLPRPYADGSRSREALSPKKEITEFISDFHVISLLINVNIPVLFKEVGRTEKHAAGEIVD